MAATRTPYFFFVFKNDDDEFRWRFYGPNNRLVAESGLGYHKREDCISSISEVCNQAARGLSIEYAPSAG